MALVVGDADADTGLAGAIYTEVDAALTAAAPGYTSADGEDNLKAIADGLAKAIVEYIVANADINNVTAGGDTVSGPNAIT